MTILVESFLKSSGFRFAIVLPIPRSKSHFRKVIDSKVRSGSDGTNGDGAVYTVASGCQEC